jgi:subtilase family serine protease
VRRWSSVCRVVPQPDLAFGDLTTTTSPQPGVQRYTIPVRNDGRADTGAFDVALRIGAEDREPVTVTGLAAGASQVVTFLAPRCVAGDVLRFEVDPDDRVAEEDERDNVLTVACPI